MAESLTSKGGNLMIHTTIPGVHLALSMCDCWQRCKWSPGHPPILTSTLFVDLPVGENYSFPLLALCLFLFCASTSLSGCLCQVQERWSLKASDPWEDVAPLGSRSWDHTDWLSMGHGPVPVGDGILWLAGLHIICPVPRDWISFWLIYSWESSSGKAFWYIPT